MPLISCPECNKEVSDQATSCPGCGYPLVRKKRVAQGKVAMSSLGSHARSALASAGSAAKEAVSKASHIKMQRGDEYVEGASDVEWSDADRGVFGWMRTGLFYLSVLLGVIALAVGYALVKGSSGGGASPLAGLWSLIYCVLMPFKYMKIADVMQSKVVGGFKRARRWYYIDIALFVCGNFLNPVCWISFIVKYFSYRRITRSVAIQSVYSDEWYA